MTGTITQVSADGQGRGIITLDAEFAALFDSPNVRFSRCDLLPASFCTRGPQVGDAVRVELNGPYIASRVQLP